MPFKTRVRRPKSTDLEKTWAEKLEPLHTTDHPRYPGQYNIYLGYIAFLTAGAVEHRWAEGSRADGRTPFVPVGARPEDFLPDLHRKMRAFRESRVIDGLSSSELARHSYELLGFLGERVPGVELERHLAVARTYVMQNEDDCLLLR